MHFTRISNYIFCSFLLFFIPFLSYANQDVIDILNKEFVSAKAKYEEKLTSCKKNRKSIEISSYQIDEFKKMNISHSDVLKAISYFNRKSNDKCVRDEMVNLYLAAGSLKTAYEMYEIFGELYEDISNIQTLLLYSNVRDVELSPEFLNLPVEKRDYLSKIFGDEPFDLIKAINSIDKYREKK